MSRSNEASTEHRSALPEGTRLQNYVLKRVLGAGGFGITYMALEEITERAVAIKEYLPSSLAVRERDGMTVQPVSESSRQDYEWGLTRFRQEAKLLLGLRHPNIVPTLNYFEANGTAYLVMGYQEGQTLSNVIGGGVSLEESEVREFIEPLLDGVEAVHKGGLLHRDIKPDNVFIRTDGTPVLIDFGSARQSLGAHSHSLTAVVTDGYAPFEQYERGGEQGPWTDIYAIGAVLFRCLVGHRPPTATKRLSAHYRGAADPAAPGFATLHQRCSPPLAAAVEAALAVIAEERPQSVADFRAMLADTGARAKVRRPDAANPTLLSGTRSALPNRAAYGETPRSESVSGDTSPRRRRKLPIFAGLAVVLLAGGAAAAYLGVGGLNIPGFTSTARDEARRTDEEAKRKAEESQRLADAEVKRKADEARKAEEEARRNEEAAAKRRADEEARRKADEDARLKTDEEKRRAEEAKRQADADARRKAEEEAKRRAEEDKRRADAEARRRAEEEAKRRADAEERRKADEEAKRTDEEARRRAEDEKRRADEAARRRADEEKRRADEEEAKRKADEERLRAGSGARPSWYVDERNRGAFYFAHKSTTIEGSAAAALLRLIADARKTPNYRITLTASADRTEGPDAARLRQQRLDAIRLWLISHGIDADKVHVVPGTGQGDGADFRYVSVALEGAAPERPNADRPNTPERPNTPDSGQRYSRAELTQMMYRLIKDAAMSSAIQYVVEGALQGGDGPTGLAVCVNWDATTPQRASINGAYHFTARSSANPAARALAMCQGASRPNCTCVIVENINSPALNIPQSFMQRYARP